MRDLHSLRVDCTCPRLVASTHAKLLEGGVLFEIVGWTVLPFGFPETLIEFDFWQPLSCTVTPE